MLGGTDHSRTIEMTRQQTARGRLPCRRLTPQWGLAWAVAPKHEFQSVDPGDISGHSVDVPER